jgi:hypothetical protein
MAQQRKFETHHFYNWIMEVDLDNRTSELIIERIFKDRYLCMRMRIDGNCGVGLETGRMY